MRDNLSTAESRNVYADPPLSAFDLITRFGLRNSTHIQRMGFAIDFFFVKASSSLRSFFVDYVYMYARKYAHAPCSGFWLKC